MKGTSSAAMGYHLTDKQSCLPAILFIKSYTITDKRAGCKRILISR